MAGSGRYGRRGFLAAGGVLAFAHGGASQTPTPLVQTSSSPVAAAAASSVELIPRRTLFAAPEYSRVTISPDGKLIAFLGPVDGVQNVWLVPLSDPTAAKPLTRIADRDVLDQLWWPHDNRHIVFFRERGGDENWQANSIDTQTGQIRALTPGPGVRSYVQQVSSRFPGELLIAHNQRDKRQFDIYRVNVATGRSTLHFRNDSFAWVFTDTQFRVRWGGRHRDDGGWDAITIGGQGAGQVFRSIAPEDARTTQMIEIADSGRELYWLDSQGRDCAAVVAQDLTTGRFRVMAENLSADFGPPVLDAVSRRPLAAPSVYTRRRWRGLDSATVNDIDRLEVAVEGDLTSISMSNDRHIFVAYAEAAGRSGRYLYYDRRSNRGRPLFAARPALDRAPLVPMRPMVIPARDGLKLVSYLSRPADAAQGVPGPTVLLVHGGPGVRDMPDFSATHQWLANRGYNVLSVNFRGSTGFGKSFVNAGDREWAGKMHDDLIDAVDWAIAERIAEPTRVGIYGGYAALVGATFTPTRFACAVDLFGIANLVTFAKAPPPYAGGWARMLKTRMGDHATEEGRQFLLSRSPISRIQQIERPLLIGQGANDVRVTTAESEQIVAEMQRRKIPVTHVLYGDEGHGFRRAANRRSFSVVVEAFLAQHLGGRFEAVGSDLEGSSIEFRAGRDLIRGLG